MRFKVMRLSVGLILLLFHAMGVSTAWSQKAAVTEIPVDPNSPPTTITVQKGGEAQKSTESEQVIDGTAEISGQPNADPNKAEKSYWKACGDWKAEVERLNKGNVIALDCGKKNPSVENYRTTYRSTATYKVKVKLKH
ncbi:MAG: hypothetical protein C5B49_16095 [Bdellovibrio sp.]|nr:MAG: hypothetical protein C5B49_16095 [Bdellovibrio sp.]